MEELEEIQLDDKPEHITWVSTWISLKLKSELVALLWTNKDVFTWLPFDMPGISLDVITHKLHVNPKAKKIRQKMRHHALEQQATIKEEE